MARIYTCGFELNSVTTSAGKEFNTQNTASVPTISATTVRSGTYSQRFSGFSGTTNQLSYIQLAAATLTVGYARAYVYFATFPGTTTQIFGLSASSATSSSMTGFQITSTGVLTAIVSSTSFGTTTLSTGTWYRLEVMGNRTTGAVEFRVDGTAFATGTATLPASSNLYLLWGRGTSVSSTVGDYFFDDIAVNDDTDVVQNSWPGSGKVAYLRPSGTGDNNTWLTSAAGAGSSTNWQAVSEVTPDDATTYLKRTTTTIKVDDYIVTSPTTAGIGATDTISLVSVSVRGSSADGVAATSSDILLRLKSATGGTVVKSGASAVRLYGAVTSFVTNGNISGVGFQPATVPELVSYADPTTAAAWTVSGTNSLTNMQIGMENQTSTTVEVRITALWAMVEYTPSSGSSASITQVAGTVTATGSTQAVATVQNQTVTQVSGSVTAAGGTQTITTINNAAISQVSATVTASGGTQTVSAVIIASVSITQVAASVTATGGTQVVSSAQNASVSQLAATVTTTGGTQSIATVNYSSIIQIAGNVTASGGAQTIDTVNNSAITQVAANVTATGGTQSLTAMVDAAIAQQAANVTASGGTQAVSASSGLVNASVGQIAGSVIATCGVPVITTSTGPIPPTSSKSIIFLTDGRLAKRINNTLYMPL